MINVTYIFYRKEAKARIEAAKAKICDDIAKKMYEVQVS